MQETTYIHIHSLDKKIIRRKEKKKIVDRGIEKKKKKNIIKVAHNFNNRNYLKTRSINN